MRAIKFILCQLVLLTLGQVQGAVKLESYNVSPDSVTVSGLSAGGAMATQFHFAFSSEVKAAGVIAGIPYGCAKGGLADAMQCMTTPDYFRPINDLISFADQQSSQGTIDSVTNIRGSKAYIFHGSSDYTVFVGNAKKVEDMYKHYGAEVKAELSFNANHGFPTNFYGAACSSSSAATQYINNCNYNGAFEMFNFFYGGSLTPPDTSVTPKGQLLEFDQSEFFSGTPASISMDSVGFVYIPSACADKSIQCKVHIAFHGCVQSRTTSGIGDAFATKTGYMHAAELNNIIVLFPQTVSMGNTNPNACFDWWGYLNTNFVTKQGAQMAAIYKMLKRVMDCPTCEEVTSPPTTVITPIPTGPTPTSTVKPPNKCSEGGYDFKPVDGLCEYYTLCACNADILLKCANGLYFDPVLKTCNFQQLVNCSSFG